MNRIGKNIRNIKNVIHNFINKKPLHTLGRWNVDYCDKKIAKKIDFSNEDHCGPCGEYKNIKEKYQVGKT
jgi:hypothetical protein